jgi:flagellar basal body rod protein FlgC
MRLPVLVALVCMIALTACNDQKSEPSEVRRAKVESEAANDDGNYKRAEVITAAREYLARYFPDWKLNGISTFHHSDNHYYVFGDVSKGDERRTVAVSVKLFVEDNEHAYWKAEYSPEEGEKATPGYVTRPYKQ